MTSPVAPLLGPVALILRKRKQWVAVVTGCPHCDQVHRYELGPIGADLPDLSYLIPMCGHGGLKPLVITATVLLPVGIKILRNGRARWDHWNEVSKLQ